MAGSIVGTDLRPQSAEKITFPQITLNCDALNCTWRALSQRPFQSAIGQYTELHKRETIKGHFTDFFFCFF